MTTKKRSARIPGRDRTLPIVSFLRHVAQSGMRSACWEAFFGITEQLSEPELVILGHMFGLAGGAQRLEQACIFCGCTERSACVLEAGTTCAWASCRPPVCTNPKCMRRAKAAGIALPIADSARAVTRRAQRR